jgi:hypothetical protein
MKKTTANKWTFKEYPLIKIWLQNEVCVSGRWETHINIRGSPWLLLKNAQSFQI